MTDGPHVSVVIPTYNRAPLLGRSVRSVLAQTYRDFELIVVDDGSTDETAAVVEGFEDPRVTYVRLARKGGAGAARNAGVRLARGRFLAFQDSDDEWLPSKLSQQMSEFERGPSTLGVVYTDMQRVWGDGTTSRLAAPDVHSGRLLGDTAAFYQVCDLGVQSTVIRREFLDAAGHFDERLPALEDLELFIRLSALCDFRRLREPLVRYHDTAGLSKDRYAKWVSRKLILRLYYKELLARNPAFVLREALWLCAARVPAEWARMREG
ncbi:MAG: glycosyltransferase family 2 protein [Acidobacteria bacterium]|nr:glycosyltransferase family 2 protein [Acidobacteriota bacterium]